MRARAGMAYEISPMRTGCHNEGHDRWRSQNRYIPTVGTESFCKSREV